ncbi:MAG TPA: leishmanolysin-related zinc metalloendopeptidase [Gemmatimonadaceae bacterium]|nr:leishmanolysin-related zinc metalloendopeptidase [Gemmatimonadaceae bacterium]
MTAMRRDSLTLFAKAIAVAIVFSACKSTEPSSPADAMVAIGSTSVTGTVGLPVASLPTIEFRDETGAPMSGIKFRVVVLSGGGTVTGTPAASISGPTSLGTWTLGPTAGGQQIRVQSSGLPSITITGTASAGAASAATATVATTLIGSFSNATTIVPAIKVADAFGNGVAGVIVTTSIGAGSGSVSVPSPVTNAAGIATVGSWTLGPTSTSQTLTMTAGALSGITFTVTASAAFKVDVRYIGTPAAALQTAAQLAALRIGQIITADIPNQPANVILDGCVPGAGTVNETVDDIVVYVRMMSAAESDGAQSVLAQASPCRPGRAASPYHPYYGVIEVDPADLQGMINDGTLNNVILHEMFHTLGIGPMWRPSPAAGGLPAIPVPDLIQFVSPSDPVFIGAEARSAYVAAGGSAPTGVPVESGGGAGTASQHWRETTLQTEIMTGFINPGAAPVSTITIASLRDLGYVTSFATADSYSVPAGQLRAVTAGATVELINDVRTGVLHALDGSVYRSPPTMTSRK